MNQKDKRSRIRIGAAGLQMLRPTRGKVVDVSGLGIGVESGKTLGVRQDYNFLLRHGLQVKKLRGCVKWCALTQTTQMDLHPSQLVYRAGIAFDELSPRVWKFLNSSTQASHPSKK